MHCFRERLFYLFLTLASAYDVKKSSRPIVGNDVISCNEVVDARRGANGTREALNGTVVSPNFPGRYPEKFQCRVDLKAPPSYRVRIVFTDFLLFHPSNSSNRNCNVMDSLSIFDGMNSQRIAILCGAGVPKPIMSSGSYMSLKFRSYTSGPNVTGYRAKYFFLNNYGLESGRQVDPNRCLFQFNSTESPKGVFFTPNPGGKYPRNTECEYVFLGHPRQRVRIHFKYFDVEGIPPCSEATQSDHVEFSIHPDAPPYSSRRCGHYAPKKVISPGSYFRVTFRSNGKFDGLGFEATYAFVMREGGVAVARPCAALSRAAYLDSPLRDPASMVSSLIVLSCLYFVA